MGGVGDYIYLLTCHARALVIDYALYLPRGQHSQGRSSNGKQQI